MDKIDQQKKCCVSLLQWHAMPFNVMPESKRD